MLKFLLIAPYRGMKDLLEDLPRADAYEVYAEVGDLRLGLDVAQAAEQNGYDVIISRGGTAQLIREHVRLPVVEITVNGYDILRSLTFVKGYRGKIGIIGFPNIVAGVDTIAELLDIQVTTFIIHQEKEAENAVDKAKSLGIDLVIGDVVTVSMAEKAGVRAVLITSGREALLEALAQAERIAKQSRMDNGSTALMKSMLNSLQHGVIGVDTNGLVSFCNFYAATQLGITAEAAMGLAWTGLSANTAGELRVQLVHHLKNQSGLAALYELYDGPTIEKLDRQHRRIKENRLSLPQGQFQQFVQTDYINETYMDKAKRWSKRLEPILITGETGTGKRTLAEAIHNESPYQEGPYVSFHAGALASERQEHLLFGDPGQEAEGLLQRAASGTLHIHQVELLLLPVQRKLAAALQANHAALENEAKPAFRFIASTPADLQLQVKQGEFDLQLLVMLQIYTIQLPPLRQLVDDLDHFIFWYLAEMNRTLGKQVLGIKPDALSKLRTYPWPGNFSELQQVLKRVVEACEGSFITIQQVSPILDGLLLLTDEPAIRSMEQLVGASRTLEEIEDDIIRYVLEQEGFNQSTTAKRLGMNRTTLWRRLNQEGR
ncbi:PrpR N-terminal domain-containing protein [Paenibacillus agricola]|uniref:Sigma 54-interacting transcriptional regulator n=1 Tax=Paenibacillus agricola TaxID=2716264 RepID=A0ABX0J564_9BACL|nr:PrpR N-terminal domain-containing protein [Paenibacillus agricola]NHN28950.1 sigma 54-interacting transcriptional regulator [Paenibacillus agricola]